MLKINHNICKNPACSNTLSSKYAIKYCSNDCSRFMNLQTANLRKQLYEENPTKCGCCSKALGYERRKEKFCCHSCSAKVSNVGVNRKRAPSVKTTTCKQCGSKFQQIRASFKVVCSVECKDKSMQNRLESYYANPEAQLKASETARKNVSKIGKRSKLEIELYNLCVSIDVAVEHNVPILEGWDADVIFPEHKIAVMWNGAWHYREIKGLKHSLRQVVNRDRIKRKLFRKHGWKVLIFEDRYWTPAEAYAVINRLITL